MARALVLAAALSVIALLAALTLSVLLREGLDILVGMSLFLLALLAFGVIGALLTPPDD